MLKMRVAVQTIFHKKGGANYGHRPLHFGTICPEVSAHHIARRAYFKSPSFRISHWDKTGSPKGETSTATISTRIPDAESPPTVQANRPQAAAIRARMLNTPVVSVCSKVSTTSASDNSRTKGAARIFKIIRMIAPPVKCRSFLPPIL